MRLLTFSELRTILGGRGRTTIYRDVSAGRLPQPIRLGGRVYWREEEIEAVLLELSDASATPQRQLRECRDGR